MPDEVAFLSPDVRVDEDAGTVSIELVRTGDLIGPVEAFYNVTGTSATAGVDFAGDAGSVIIPAGETTGFIDIPILDDDLVEDALPAVAGSQPESFGVSIETVADGAVGVPRTTNVFIVDDESDGAAPAPPSPTEAAYTVTEEVITPDVGIPIRIQWLPSDPSLMLIANLGGLIRVYDTTTETFLPDFIDLRDEVNSVQDRGLIDFAFHPDFPDVPKVYMTYSVDPPGTADATGLAGPDGGGNRFVWLVSYDVDLSGPSPAVDPASKEILVGAAGQTLADIAGGGALDYTSSDYIDVTAYPASDLDPATGGYKQDYWKIDSASHIGGGIAFGPDGALYVGVGDGTSFNYADERTHHVQDVDALAGKILRIDPLTGEGLADNPFYTGDPDANASKVWQSGLRNPLRLAFDDDGELFISNTGWFSWEEIESGGPGANFGWPLYEGGDGGTLVEAPDYVSQPGLAPYYAEVASGEREITAAYRSFSHTAGITPIEVDAIVGGSSVYQGARYPGLQGSFPFIDSTRGDAVYGVDTDDRTNLRKLFDLPEGPVVPGAGRLPVGIVQGPDGHLYFPDLIQNFVGRWILEPADGTPTPPSVITGLEAETAVLGGDTITVGDEHPFYRGTGYVDFGGEGDFIDWTLAVEAEDAGTYEIGVRFANGLPTELGPLTLEVDGEVVDTLVFPPTGITLDPPSVGNWSVWYNTFASDTVDFDAGTHSVRLISEGGDGPNVDRLILREAMEPAPVPAGTAVRLEAEDAFVAGGTARADDEQPGYRGTGYIDLGAAATDSVKWTVDVAEAGVYNLGVRYANGLDATETMTLEVDGEEVETLAFRPTGDWGTWRRSDTSEGIALDAGTHTIRVTSDGDDGPNVDLLVIAPAPDAEAEPPSAPPATVPDVELVGTANGDRLVGDAGDDSISGGNGSDALAGRGGNDTIDGGWGKDWLFGNAGDDLLQGRGGGDVLHGGRGTDRLVGGWGDDLYVIDAADDGVDWIFGFRSDEQIRFDGFEPSKSDIAGRATDDGRNTAIDADNDGVADVVLHDFTGFDVDNIL
jgi:glucose/arabinose dehydrogenase/Ca2+-binding RTX toxin-like protein